MAAGLRYKFQGSTIAVLTGYEGASPLGAITGITNANPAVVTSNAHGQVAGDVVLIDGVLGMTEVNDQLHVISAADTNTFTLAGVDATGYGTYTSGGTFDPGVFSNFCELTNYNRQGGTSPEIPATTICSTAVEKEVGLPDFGTTQLSYNFAPTTTVQGALQAAYVAGTQTAVRIVLPNGGGTMIQAGTVQTTSETAGVGGLWTATATISNTGNRVDVL